MHVAHSTNGVTDFLAKVGVQKQQSAMEVL